MTEPLIIVHEVYCEQCGEIVDPELLKEGHILRIGPPETRNLDLCRECMSEELGEMMKE